MASSSTAETSDTASANASNHSYSGRLICFEGIDGSGKSHFCHKLAEHLTAKGIKTQLTHEPGGTPAAEEIAQILLHFKDESVENIVDDAELLLFFAARCQHITNFIIPKLKQGYWIITDRFTPSSYAYQGAGRGLGWDKVAALESYLPPIQPDLLLLLDLDISQSSQRWEEQQERDRFEKMLTKNGDFFAQVRQGYLNYAAQHPHTKVLDASLPEDEVWQLVQQEVAKILPQ